MELSASSIMRTIRRIVLVFGLLLPAITAAQVTASLETAETRLQFEAGPPAPILAILRHSAATRKNRAAETLISSAEITGQSVPIEWEFNSDDSRTNKDKASFVYARRVCA